MQSQSSNKFGKQRLQDFYVDKSYTNLNHGSYGYTPKSVISYKRQLEQRVQFNAETWYRKDMEGLVNETRAFIAKKVNAPKQNIFMVQNATDAFNGLMKSIHWKEGDVILLPNTAYMSIKKTCDWLKDYYRVQILSVNYTQDDLKTSESLQAKIEETVNGSTKKIKCAVIDHISSMPSVVFPIKSIQQFLSKHGIDLFVDGAHAIGQVEIDIDGLGCQSYFSNLHKWAFTPKSAAFIYISEKPTITGNYRGNGVDKQYFWTGTRDCTPYMCVQKGIQYLESFGPNEVQKYNHKTVVQGARLMAQIWKTSMISEDERCIANMACVWLPSSDQKTCLEAHEQLRVKQNTYMAIGNFNGRMFVRLCGQIYNQIQDYKKAAQKFLEILNSKL